MLLVKAMSIQSSMSSMPKRIKIQLAQPSYLPTHDLFSLGKSEGPAPPPSSKISWSFDLAWNPVGVWWWCLMSSDVIWHIRDKLWPMPKHGSVILYVHGNHPTKARQVRTDSPGRPPRLSHSSWTMSWSFFFLSCCLTSTEARWPIRDVDRVGRGRESHWKARLTAETARLEKDRRDRRPPPEQWKC